MIRLILVLAVLALSLGACENEQKRQETEKVCANVTNDNWRHPDWNESSKDVCKKAYRLLSWDHSKPCMYDGNPVMCQIDLDDGSILVKTFYGIKVTEISPSDYVRMVPRIKIID